MKIQNPPPFNNLEAPKELPENPELRQKARDFEALFINQMISAMRKTVPENGLIPKSQGERVFESMLDSQNAQTMADTEQLGLSQVIYQHLLRQYGGQ